MITKTKKNIQIPREDWEKMKKNPAFFEAVELLEDIDDLEKARKVKGKNLTLDQYLEKRGLQNNFGNQLKYFIEFKRTALKDLENINTKDARRIISKIKILEGGLKGDIKRLTNYTPEYRLRVGNFRILFETKENKIIIYRIKHRKESYK